MDAAGDAGRARAAARERLLALRLNAIRRLHGLDAAFTDIVDAARDSNLDDEHDPEGSTIAAERSLVGSLATRGREQLREIDEALARLDIGRYGICVSCGEPVGAGRLQARPAAARCIRCARRA